MSYSKQLVIIGKKLGGTSYKKLVHIAQKTAIAYAVQSGDTLSGIAQKQLGNASYWKLLYELNKSVVGPNPNLIYPGQQLKIPGFAELEGLKDKFPMSQEMPHAPSGGKLTFDQFMRGKLVVPKGSVSEKELAEKAKEHGMVRVDDLLSIANAHPYVVPQLRGILEAISSSFPGYLAYLTEGWPSTSNVHGDSRHYNGHAMDVTLNPRVNRQQREQLTQWIASKGFRVLNEYDHPVSTTTGGHIHIGTQDAGSPTTLS